MDYIKLLNSVGKRNFTWDDFNEIVNGFLFVKTSPEYEKLLASNETLSTVEETLIERVLNGQRHTLPPSSNPSFAYWLMQAIRKVAFNLQISIYISSLKIST